MRRDVLGLRIVEAGADASPVLARVRQQLRAADALITIEAEPAEPADVRECRRVGEQQLQESRYEEAQETFLECIEMGLRSGYFCWHAAANLVNCHRFLGRLGEADATAEHLLEMYAEQPDHPIHYLLATQRGAIAADCFDAGEPDAAETALHFAQRAYDWQIEHRGQADGLRAYNLVVAHLRLGHRDEALAIHDRHVSDESFQDWCRQGDQAEAIQKLIHT